MQVHVEYPTQPKAVQDELEAAVALAKPEQADPTTGLLHIVVGVLVYIGRLFIYPRYRRFVVERCEKLEAASGSGAETSATKPKSKSATKKGATKQAKRSK
ncbi:MAG: hypothetical protein IT225_02765 [Flavobacteriales bacterium]|jgi:hypothetical protein|nr:hypothetical protein [Flavobacteriales bacterium]